MAYNHAMTIAYEVISDNPYGPSIHEAWAALKQRMAQLETDEAERHEALMSDAPFDTFETEDMI